MDNTIKMMQMSPWDFDQDPDGWRKFESTKEYLKAANLIRDYIARNNDRILHPLKGEKTVSLETMYFHIGQLLAFEGKEHYQEATESFKRSLHNSGECWNAYVSATIGFLANNTGRIEAAILAIDNSKEEDKRSGNISIVKNFSKALVSGIRDYKEVYSWPRE